MGKGIKFGSGGGGSGISNGYEHKYYAKGEDVPAGVFAFRSMRGTYKTHSVVLQGGSQSYTPIFDGEKVGTNRALFVCSKNQPTSSSQITVTEPFTVRLMEIDSSDNVTEVATVSASNEVASRSAYTLTKMSDNIFILSYMRAYSNAMLTWHRIITVAGDTVTIGEPASTTAQSSTYGNNVTAGSCRLTSSRFAVFYYGYIYLYEYAGETITLVSSLKLSAFGVNYNNLVGVDENTVIAYAQSMAQVVKINGDEITAIGTATSVIGIDTNEITPDLAFGNNILMVSGSRNMYSQKAAIGFSEYHPEDNTLEYYGTVAVGNNSGTDGIYYENSAAWVKKNYFVAGNSIKGSNNISFITVNKKLKEFSLYTTIISGAANYHYSKYVAVPISEAKVMMLNGARSGSSSSYVWTMCSLVATAEAEVSATGTAANLIVTRDKCNTRLPGRAYSQT